MKIPNLLQRKALGYAALATLLLTAGGVIAQVKKGKVRPMTTAQWMKGVMKPHCTALKNGLEASPSKDEIWSELAVHAALINEASYLLMEDGRCPDGVWANAAGKTLREGSAEVLKAIEAKDTAGAKAAFEKMTKGCAACHEKHREKK
ncbi:MAG: cytochrome c [Verrucomicrobia bacterium]|nr:cytochrome c [Verrucomicrobiota bacterium]